jgi:hypothetical protein
MAKNDPRNIQTDRSKAIEWWNSLPMYNMDIRQCKRILAALYFNREQSLLTGREIEIIWKAETKIAVYENN